MSYRPENSSEWIAYRDHCIKIILDTCDNEESDHINIFEAGADAMLEQSPSISLDLTAMLAKQVGMAVLGSCPYTKVKIIFIPEEAE